MNPLNPIVIARHQTRRGVMGVVLAVAVSSFAARAEEAPVAEAKATDAPSAASAAQADAEDLKPRISEVARLSTRSLLLGLARAGDMLVTIGDRGNILRSKDGKRWFQVVSPTNSTLTAITFADAQQGWIVGHDASILHTADGGKTWKLQYFKPEDNKPLFGITALDAQHAYAVGAYGLFLVTQDGGENWSAVDAGPVTEEGMHLNALTRLGNGDLFVVGEAGLIGAYGVDPKVAAEAEAKAQAEAKARRPGKAAPADTVAAAAAPAPAWQRLTLPYEGSLFGVLPRGERGALVYGLRGNVFVTDDVYANQWTRIDTGTVQSLFGAAVLDGGRILLVGADGAVLQLSVDGVVRPALSDKTTADLASGTLSAALPWQGGVLLVGDLGVHKVPLRQP